MGRGKRKEKRRGGSGVTRRASGWCPGGAAARVGLARCRCAGSAVVAVRTESGGRRKMAVGSLADGSHMSARERERGAGSTGGASWAGCWATRREEKKEEKKISACWPIRNRNPFSFSDFTFFSLFHL